MTTEVYMIRRKSDGLFSPSGHGEFRKRGKAWTSLGFVKNHLTMFVNKAWAKNIINVNQGWQYKAPFSQYELIELGDAGIKVIDTLDNIFMELALNKKKKTSSYKECKIDLKYDERKGR